MSLSHVHCHHKDLFWITQNGTLDYCLEICTICIYPLKRQGKLALNIFKIIKGLQKSPIEVFSAICCIFLSKNPHISLIGLGSITCEQCTVKSGTADLLVMSNLPCHLSFPCISLVGISLYWPDLSSPRVFCNKMQFQVEIERIISSLSVFQNVNMLDRSRKSFIQRRMLFYTIVVSVDKVTDI